MEISKLRTSDAVAPWNEGTRRQNSPFSKSCPVDSSISLLLQLSVGIYLAALHNLAFTNIKFVNQC
eukprot:scaffold332446_cov14-Prasinocladus_malaysianus.AAC.1